MYTQFEEKGKIFTPVVTKKPVRVTIQTTTHLIHGNIHVRPDERIKDALKAEEAFLAVTEAEVLGPDQQVLYRTRFLAVSQTQIVWLLPDDELMDVGAGDE